MGIALYYSAFANSRRREGAPDALRCEVRDFRNADSDIHSLQEPIIRPSKHFEAIKVK